MSTKKKSDFGPEALHRYGLAHFLPRRFNTLIHTFDSPSWCAMSGTVRGRSATDGVEDCLEEGVETEAAPHYATATAKLFKHAVAGNGLADHRRESYVQ